MKLYTSWFLLGFIALSFFNCSAKQEINELNEVEQMASLPEPQFLKMPIVYQNGDSIFEISNKLRIEGFYGDNLRLHGDEVIIPGKHTYDLNFLYRFKPKSHGYDVMKVKSTIRNKGTWGDPESIANTGFSTIKDLDAVIGDHQHPINVHVPIIRELWMEFEFGGLFNRKWDTKHYFTMGLFPFQLGRGISLGDAYTTTPDLLGYNPANSVQQYAPGFKLSGEIIEKRRLTYDIYFEVADNKAGTFDNENQRMRANQYGHKFNQARGPRILNYIAAARLKWLPWDSEGHWISLEPYGLFDHEKEQKIDFIGDSSSKLATFGFAFESECGDWEFGGEVAKNFGHQNVKGVDKNIVEKELRIGIPFFVNSKVIAINDNPATNDLAGKKAVFVKANQQTIDTSFECASQNGMPIGNNLQNDDNRFRNPYENKYHGAMAVFDMAYWLHRPHAKLALAVGFASGDEAPHKVLTEDDERPHRKYDGFISLQEIYNGTRVKSAFLLNGSGKVPRVLSFPSSDLVGDRFATTVTRFTNLIYTGSALWLKFMTWSQAWSINPNALAYWQDNRTHFFDRDESGNLKTGCARRYLGLELNTFIETMILVDLKFFLVGAVFIPGGHFKDIQGRPLNKDQQKFLDSLNDTGVRVNKVPLLNACPGYFVNIGLEYKF